MNILWCGVERFAEISTVLLNIYFLYRTLETKISVKKQVIAATVFIAVRMIYYVLFFEFRPYFAVFAAIIYACFVFEGRFRIYIVWNVVAVVIDGIVDATVASAYLLLPHASIDMIATPGIDRTIIVVIAKSFLFISYYFVTQKVDKQNKLSDSGFALALLIPVGCWLLLEVLFEYSRGLSKTMAQMTLTVGSFALLLIIISAIILYNRVTSDGKELARSKLQLRMVEVTQNHIAQVKMLYAQLSSVRHDLNNHFSAILGYANENQYDELKEYVRKLIDMDIKIAGHTNHPVIDILINTRSELAAEKGIDFETNFIFPNPLPIDDVDLCILIGNMLDNAFEASAESASPRYVNITARVVNSYWTLACRNSVQNKGSYRSSCSMNSTKTTPDMHGIGTRQIQTIAEKTGGFVSFKHDGYDFSTLVMLKLSENQLPANNEV